MRLQQVSRTLKGQHTTLCKMNVLNPFIFAKKEPNTFIGGVGGNSVNSPSDIVSRTSLLSTQIKNFKITGNNVSFYTAVNYSINNSAFKGDTYLTSYNDADNHVVLINSEAFRGCVNFIEGYFNGCTTLIDGTNTATTGVFRGCSGLEVLELASAIQTNSITSGFYTFSGLTAITYLDLPPTYRYLSRFVFAQTNLNNVNLSHITSLGTGVKARTFQNAFGTANLPSVVNAGEQSFYSFEGTQVILPNLTAIANKNSYFALMTSSIALIEAKKLKSLNDPANHLNMFLNLKTGVLIKVHEDLATNNSGSADASLVYAKASRGATVEFYDADGNYVSTL